MSWQSTHEYYRALREVEDELDRRGGIESLDDLPWRPAYAHIFGDRAGLLLALRRRWKLLVQAQVEQAYDGAGMPTVELLALAARHRGLLTVLLQREEPATAARGARPSSRRAPGVVCGPAASRRRARTAASPTCRHRRGNTSVLACLRLPD